MKRLRLKVKNCNQTAYNIFWRSLCVLAVLNITVAGSVLLNPVPVCFAEEILPQPTSQVVQVQLFSLFRFQEITNAQSLPAWPAQKHTHFDNNSKLVETSTSWLTQILKLLEYSTAENFSVHQHFNLAVLLPQNSLQPPEPYLGVPLKPPIF